MTDLDDLVASMTLEEKAALLNGDSMWTVHPVERLGIASLRVTDGPVGARGSGFLDSGTPTLCVPCGTALGASFDVDLLERVGVALGEEARAKSAQVLLAPTINIHRHPLGGRNFECYSEDPYLTGRLAAAYVRGVQSQGVATTPKHFVGNDGEFERNTIDVRVDERTLREIYLRPFEMVLSGPDQAWGVMSAYNRLNGTFCSEHPWLLTAVLRDEWGFDGVVVSDWFAARSTGASANAGLDLEMPGPGAQYGRGQLEAAVRAGEVDEATVDTMVRRLLVLAERTGLFDGPAPAGEVTIDSPAQRALAREAAAAGTVLLRNEGGAVPIDPAAITRLAVLGPNASRAQVLGGGSAALRPYRYRSPLVELQDRLGDSVEIVHEPGCLIDRSAPVVDAPLDLVFTDLDGVETTVESLERWKSIVLGVRPPLGLDWNASGTSAFVAATTGRHELTVIGLGATRLWCDEELVVDIPAGAPRGDTFFGFGSEAVVVPLDLTAGQEVIVRIETEGRRGAGGFQVGLQPPDDPARFDRAVAAAAAADLAVVVVGTNADWETEGRDRDSMVLPGDQDRFVAAVAAVCPRTIVVVNAGAPVSMPWIDAVDAVVEVWFGGQELGPALADVLLGEVDPSGRLPTTFPLDLRHAPSHPSYPGENSVVRYGEGLLVGYRGYEATDRPVLFPFGHGLSTTTFAVGAASVTPDPPRVGDTVTVSVPVTNTGARRGAHVVQCYLSAVDSRLTRAPKWLAGFAKVWLDPGESTVAEVVLDDRAFSVYDPGDPGFAALQASGPVPAGGGHARRDDAGWVVEPGAYRLHVARSSAVIDETIDLVLGEA